MAKQFTGENYSKQKIDGFNEYSNGLNDLNPKEFSQFCFTASVISESLQEAKQSVQSDSYPSQALISLINFFSKRGDVVLNLFSGVGDTLTVISDLGRTPVGVEYDKNKVDSYYTAVSQDQFSEKAEVFQQDALEYLLSYQKEYDFILMEPPRLNSKSGKFKAEDISNLTYEEYCSYIACCINKSVSSVRKGRYVVVCLEDIYFKGQYTSPIFDIMSKVNTLLCKGIKIFVRDLPSSMVKFSNVYAPFKNHFYALIFQK